MADWWVVEADIGASEGPTYQVIESSTKPNPALVETGEHTTTKVSGPYATQGAAQATIPAGSNQGPATPSNMSNAQPQSPVSNPLDFLSEIGDFFHRLTEAATWIRIAKVVIGAGLVIVGLAHMTGASGALMDAARKAPLPV